MTRIVLAFALGIAALAAIGCTTSDERPEVASTGVEVAAAAAVDEQGGAVATGAEVEAGCDGAAAGGACEEAKPHGDPKVETSCGQHGAGTALTNTAERPVTHTDGAQGTHIGGDFVQEGVVKVSELLADPGAWEGKVVQVEGDISAMCGRKRTWFSVAAEDKSGGFVRVSAAPTFLVPAGSVGRFARAEGTVEVIEVAAKHARHLAEQHKLGDPEAIRANVQRVVIRAAGAEFF